MCGCGMPASRNARQVFWPLTEITDFSLDVLRLEAWRARRVQGSNLDRITQVDIICGATKEPTSSAVTSTRTTFTSSGDEYR
jgi:hypothetical protein